MNIHLMAGRKRIQAEENHQDTPDGPNIDLFTGIHHKVVTLSEEVDAHCIDGKVDQPLVLHEEAQNCIHTHTQCGKQKQTTLF